MKYEAPKINNDPYYVPVVVKSKDYLVGYLHAMNLFLAILHDCLNRSGLDIDCSNFDMGLDSTRFNDIMIDGRRATSCSIDEIKQYFEDLIEKKVFKYKEEHPDNNPEILDKSVLKIECICGLGFYSFDDISKIPEEPLKCSACGRVILDYTKHFDNEFEFDGKETKWRS